MSVLEGVGVREGAEITASVIEGVDKGLRIGVFVFIVGTVAKNGGTNGFGRRDPTMVIKAQRKSVRSRAKPPMDEQIPVLLDLRGAMLAVFRKIK